MASLGRRISQLEQLKEQITDQSFAAALHEARMRLRRGEARPQTPITQKMLDDPVEGWMWRKIRDARARVQRAGRPAIVPAPPETRPIK